MQVVEVEDHLVVHLLEQVEQVVVDQVVIQLMEQQEQLIQEVVEVAVELEDLEVLVSLL
jgi:hypothetical protein